MDKSDACRAYRDECAREYRLTIIDNRILINRLASEISFAADQIHRAWPELRSDPIAFGSRLSRKFIESVTRALREPNAFASCLTAFLIVAVAVLLVILGQGRQQKGPDPSDLDDFEMVTLKLGPETAPRAGSGIGAGRNGRVGLADAKGEGTKRETRQSRGGGGSGKRDKPRVPEGRLVQPAEIPAPILPLPKNRSLPLAGIDIDPLLWKAQHLPVYGDPRSSSNLQSNGPGEGGNFGEGKGPGAGEGHGPGFGPGEKGNVGDGEKSPGGGGPGGSFGQNSDDPDRVLRLSQVAQRARVLTKPEPQYTEAARRNQITGTVVLRVVFSRSGQVTNIQAIQSLPFGLTEQAIMAARQIRFSPAIKDGRPVSVYMQLEYNFNLY